MLPIIEAKAASFRGRSLFRMAQLDLFSLQLPLQRGAGRGSVGEPALLAVSDGAPRQIPPGPGGEAGAAAFAPPVAGETSAGDLGSRLFRWGGAGGRGFGGGTAAPLSAAQDLHFNHHGYGPGTRPQTLWREECDLFSHGLRIRHPPLPAGSASATGGDCRNRVLAQLHAVGACAGRADCGGECPHLGSLLAALPAISGIAAEVAGER